MASQVDLVLPGLFNLPAAELDADFVDRQLPSLNHLIRFSHRRPNTLLEVDSILSECLGLDASRILPFGSAFVQQKDTGQGNHVLCRAAHLKPDLRNAFVIPLDETTETLDDIGILINDLGGMFKQDCDFTDLGEGLWLMRLNDCLPPSHFPHYLSIVGRKVDQYIEQSRAALPWYQLMNEMQMFLHSHEVNQRRLQEGRLVINSLWCWGAGEFIQPKSTHTRWYSDEPALKAYGEKAGISQQPVEAFCSSDLTGDTLIHDLSLMTALKSPSDQDLSELLLRLETGLFEPLLKQIKAGQIMLRVRPGHENDLMISSSSRYRFWRKSVNLLDWLD